MLEVGMKNTVSRVVTEDLTAAAFDASMVPVLATPFLVAFIEDAAAKCVEKELPETRLTVGTQVNVRHLAATPVGMTATFEAVLTEIDRRRLTFAVRAWDETGPIAEGTHERFIVDRERFMAQTNAKLEGRRGAGETH